MQDERREGVTTADLSGAASAERVGRGPSNEERERLEGAELPDDEHPEPLLGNDLLRET